jgi:hypothetical protein
VTRLLIFRYYRARAYSDAATTAAAAASALFIVSFLFFYYYYFFFPRTVFSPFIRYILLLLSATGLGFDHRARAI